MNTSYMLALNNIGKAYRQYSSEWKRVISWFGFKSKAIKEIWTLHDISFRLGVGETLGIVGQNGAGKSTLLKIIASTLKASTGTLECKGRIAAILELGMGFHPDLTGRQNAYNAAGLMGFNHSQIDAIIDEIASFAEIGDYFDEPVRLYSSGMQVRVAFAVATAYRPDILIIDEALSVGDVYFQHKCFERINAYRKQGTSLLFVSHDTNAILALCDKAILLEKGAILKEGSPQEVMDFYNAFIAQKEENTIEQTHQDGKVKTISGTGEAKVEAIALYNHMGEKVEVVGVGEKIKIRLKIAVYADLPSLVLGYSIKDRLGQTLFGTNTWHTQQVIKDAKANEQYEVSIDFEANYGVGSYSVQTALVDQGTHLSANYEWRDLALLFDVANKDKDYFVGLLWNEPTIRIEKI